MKLIENIWSDLRYAVRNLAQAPQFTLTAILALALSVSIGSSMFSIVNAYFFRPLPVKDGNKLVMLVTQRPTSSALRYMSYPNYKDIRDNNDVFTGLFAYSFIEARVAAPGVSQQVLGQAVTGNYFDALGVVPFLGRALRPDDDTLQSIPAIAVSHNFWQAHLASDPEIAGKTLRLNGSPFTVAGVMPADFYGTDMLLRADVWIPIAHTATAGLGSTDNRAGNGYRVLGQLRPDISEAEAQAGIDAVTQSLREQYPVENRDLKTFVIPEPQTRPIIDAAGVMRTMALLMIGAFIIGLTINGANMTSLMLVRVISREREISLRLALGATRSRLGALLLTESLLLSFAGSAVGFAVTTWIMSRFSGIEILPSFYLADVRPDSTVILLTALLATAVGVGIGMTPALAAMRTNIVAGLHTGGASARRPARLRSRAVCSQFAMLVWVLAMIGVSVGSMNAARTVDLGFETSDRLLARIAPAEYGYDVVQARQLTQDFIARVKTLPGVVSAAAVSEVPLGWDSSSIELVPADGVAPVQPARVSYTVVTEDYFSTISTPILQGRPFDSRDRDGGVPSIIVNETLAADFWPGQSPLGKRIMSPRDNGESDLFEVVGVARTAKYLSIGEQPRGYAFLPYGQRDRTSMTVIAHTAQGLPSLAPGMRQALTELDADMALSEVTSFDELIESRNFGALHFSAVVLPFFALLTLIVAVVEMYGLLSYFARFQVREIGIRMALGATPRAIVGLITGRGLRLAIVGIAIGLTAAVITARWMQSTFFGLAAIHPATFAIVPALIVTVTFLAGYLPARRVLKESPTAALRHE